MGWFERGRIYNRRRDVHDRLGGQQQGGISTPTDQPFVILFTGTSGEAHGYSDGWTEDGVFRYFGEGQVGDMEWVRGNRAIRDHAANGKDLLLFKMARKGEVRFLGEFACAGYEVTESPDTNGNIRAAFVFDLVALADLEGDASEPVSTPASDLSALRRRALEAASTGKQPDANSAKRNVYERSAAVRDYVLARADGRCEGCDVDAPFIARSGQPYLEPHHIRRVSDGGPDHPAFVVALCPNCHRRVHSGRDGDEYNQSLAIKIRKTEPDAV